MAQATGLTQTYNIGTAGGIREDLEDKIWDLFADDTWALTNLDRVKANAVYHEWLKDSLASAASNTALEGDEATFTTLSAPTRVGNYCQITRKTFLVSGTLEATSLAGRARESARQTVRKMRELKNDMEFDVMRNHASMAGNGGAGSARSSAGMESWISTNEFPAATSTAGTTPGFLSGIVAAPTDATQAALSEGVFKNALAGAWAQGGDARIVFTNSSTKSVIDGFTGIVTRNVDISRRQQATIIGAANVYVSSYGVHTVILHRHVRGNVIMAIDPDYWALAFLRNPFMEQLSKTGDGVKYMMLAEWTLVSRNEAASTKCVGVL
jgi:hypothetical protein